MQGRQPLHGSERWRHGAQALVGPQVSREVVELIGVDRAPLLAAHQPRQYIAGALSSEGDLTHDQLAEQVAAVFADEVKRQFILDLGPTAEQGRDRRAGYDNDLAQFGRIESLELERITAPTLIIQGTNDSDLPPAQSYFAAETIPGATLLRLEEGTHLALYTNADAEAAQQRVMEFLRTHG